MPVAAARTYALRLFLVALATFTLLFTLPATASAATFVSVAGKSVNIRAQPNTRSQVLWELSRGYPLQVQARQGKWLKVRDFETSLGWIYAPLTNKTRHRVIKVANANLRARASSKSRIMGKLHRYDVVRTLGTSGSWAHVRTAGGLTGWIATRLTWGS